MLTGDGIVGVPQESAAMLIGIAAYSVTTAGDMVGIYGPGNLVNARISSTASAGDFVGAYFDGFLYETTTYSGAVITKAASAIGGIGEVLILGPTVGV